jgi:FkbM family methyltransferase
MRLLGTRLNDVAKRSGRVLGVEISRYSAMRSGEARRARILLSNKINLVLDVGGNTGQYGHLLRRSGYQGRLVSFEPESEAFRHLENAASRDARWDCLCVALGRANGSARLRIGDSSVTSSLLPLEPHLADLAGWSRIGEETVTVSTIDSLSDALMSAGEHVFLKVDTEGFELQVLEGATATLPRIRGVEVELHLVPHFRGQPDYREVIGYLEEGGLHLASLDCGWADPSTGQVHYLDAIFIRGRPVGAER